MQNFELLSFASADELARAAASAWLDEIELANRAGKPHCVALSARRITQKFFAATVEQAKTRAVSFERVHFFWADERCVPPTEPESNFKLANELLFAPLNISAETIHRLRGEDSPQAAVKNAGSELYRIAPQNKYGQPEMAPRNSRLTARRSGTTKRRGRPRPCPARPDPELPGRICFAVRCDTTLIRHF